VTSGLTSAADPNAKRPPVTFGQVDEPVDPLRIGEPHLPPAPCSSSASWSDIRFYVAVKSRPAPDSLITRKNSLIARINSLQGRIKFPVPMRRELGRKPLNLGNDFEPIVAEFGFRDGFARDLASSSKESANFRSLSGKTRCQPTWRCGAEQFGQAVNLRSQAGPPQAGTKE
jgi:hypothetical protein